MNYYNIKITPKTSILFIYFSHTKMTNNKKKKQKPLKFLKLLEIRTTTYQL